MLVSVIIAVVASVVVTAFAKRLFNSWSAAAIAFAFAFSLFFGSATSEVWEQDRGASACAPQGIVVVERDGVDSQDGFSGCFVATAYDASGVVVAREVEEVDRAERLSGDVSGFVSCFQERGFSVVRR